MGIEELYKELHNVKASRESRLKHSEIILNDLTLLPLLIDIMFRVDDKISCRAAWVFEFVCIKYIYAIIPCLEKFTQNLHKVHFDSAMRSISKICALIARAQNSNDPNPLKKALLPRYKEYIIESCFDWLINEQKVATKVHAMETLFLLGKNSNWIHKELVNILERDYQTQSAGFQARAKRILRKIKSTL